ncbi:glycogen debranching enzyme GlgX [Rippkaea orientalis PCC 8801]|uniref:Glycogen debranching enzyme GlgX n=1 Tax=Rippkaea orientalis (strain PCC 8801 / RF-1) TaxID=41431 RepID=B7JX76_RIPO1|nr:alpha-amylase family glycosyl hydrolase [Rippkaea orientalis]ACK67064.1 glycogen debranching enzyme GlgX [Rippkaea orientalis PCC 8801]
MKISTGKPYPLGATWDGKGTNFALFSENATEVELCVFDEQNGETRVQLVEVENHVWYGYLAGIKPGQKYGFRVYGPYQPEKGHYFNPNKLLVDPYAKAIAGDVNYGQELFNYCLKDSKKTPTLHYLGLDNAYLIPKSVVVDDSFDWEKDQLLKTPWEQTIIYETHVKGLTQQHPDIPENLRGTYAGLAHPAMINYFKLLGITAIELLPIHHYFSSPQFLHTKGLRDYWGYRTLGYFAPYSAYSSSGILGEQVTEFKQMVKTLHKAGIEVILDVVYNHSAEGSTTDPTLCFRGIDNSIYYVLNPENKREYLDFTGCGNSLNVNHSQVLKLIIDSLRYWVTEMHVDGFRFDLAPTLARELFSVEESITEPCELSLKTYQKDHLFQKVAKKITKIKYDPGAAFFDILHQDPILSQVKLIAEGWDIADGGYQVGNFPKLWSEWNDKYRDTMRNFWRSELHNNQEFLMRFLGSSDLYKQQGKRPYASLNFITCHDGFTLNDLVSYNDKHNDANGENNRDGSGYNHSWNCQVEGATNDPEILALREKQKRNFLVSLFLSQGVPMLLGGDEIGRTQQGNNNAYCQDNAEFSWFNWDLTPENRSLVEFTQQLIQLRRQHPIFWQRNWLDCYGNQQTIYCFNPDGTPIEDQEIKTDHLLGIWLNSAETDQSNFDNNDSFILLFNGHWDDCQFSLPSHLQDQSLRVIIDTDQGGFVQAEMFYQGSESILVKGRSLVILSL